MADDKKNIPDTGKIDNPSEPGKVEPAKATPPVQEQPAPAKAETPKDKDAPAPSMEGAPQPGKDEKQATISGMGDPAPAGKVVDFTTAREGTAKGKPTEKAAAPDKDKQADKSKDAAKPQPRDKMGLLIKCLFIYSERKKGSKKDAHRRLNRPRLCGQHKNAPNIGL